MAFGVGERPERSASYILQQVDYPATRDEIVRVAEDSEAPTDTLNFLRRLPNREYRDPDDVLRQFAEAEARAGMGTRDVHHRGDLGKEMTEPPDDHAHHP